MIKEKDRLERISQLSQEVKQLVEDYICYENRPELSPLITELFNVHLKLSEIHNEIYQMDLDFES